MVDADEVVVRLARSPSDVQVAQFAGTSGAVTSNGPGSWPSWLRPVRGIDDEQHAEPEVAEPAS